MQINVVTIENRKMEEKEKSLDDEEWETDSSEEMESEAFDEKAMKLLECGEEQLYFMIQPRSSSIAKGVVDDLVSLPDEEGRELDRIQVELDCRFEVDRTFTAQLMKDSKFVEAIEQLRKKNEKGLNSYVLFLNSMFENRYSYLYLLYAWTKVRLEHLSRETEREGLVEFFETEATRFDDSIPPIKAFESFVERIKMVRSLLHKTDVSKVVEKVQAKAADDIVVENATFEESNEPVVEHTELSEQTSYHSLPPQSQTTTITLSPPAKKRKEN